jgi:hypothetical protein
MLVAQRHPIRDSFRRARVLRADLLALLDQPEMRPARNGSRPPFPDHRRMCVGSVPITRIRKRLMDMCSALLNECAQPTRRIGTWDGDCTVP